MISFHEQDDLDVTERGDDVHIAERAMKMKSKPFGKKQGPKKGPKPGLIGKFNKTDDEDDITERAMKMKSKPFGKKKGPKPGLLKMKSKPFGKKKGPKPGLKGKFNKTVDAEVRSCAHSIILQENFVQDYILERSLSKF
ncbi:hypothetical protein PoB_005852800 [Plakobranchus ocellatus]|uniref:Triple QxxK/R motif-containing protein n=1 Tax=Plakobranchus ocellatus TaxID=259542 RepID=A0AAV4CLG3_9GAST|nr:hypothetical protein PoB_005852800 [Plakobranchus ocellatus]